MILADNRDCNPACRVCHYKHLDYTAQLARKNAWARECLGEWSEVLRPIRPAPEGERLGYRAKTWLRTKFFKGTLSFGMYRALRGEAKWEKEFVAWDTCPLHQDSIRASIAALGPALAAGLPGFCADSLFGVWIGGPHLVVIAKDSPAAELARLDWSTILQPPLARAWIHRTSQVGKSVFGENPIVPLFGAPAAARDPIRAFRQIAQSLLQEARTRAIDYLLQDRPDAVLDLYCGTGEMAERLPLEVGWIGIESSKEAIACANSIRPPGRRVHEAFLGLVEHRLRDPRVIERIPARYNVYVNPPRPGLGESGRELFIDLIRDRRPARIAYLSCSASSLARDLSVLTHKGYRVEKLQPYDFFPQTEHFETLALMKDVSDRDDS